LKKTLITILQILVTVGLLWWIFHDPEKRAQMAEALKQADYWWLVAGALLYGGVTIVCTQRWWLLLRVQNIHLPWKKVWQLLMVGLFFNLFLPGGTGGDIIKIFYLLREVPDKKSTALLSVVVDRMIGLLGLVVIAVVICCFRFDLLTKTPETSGLLSIFAIVLGAFLAVLATAFFVSKFRLVHRLPERMPLRGAIVELATAIETYGQRPKVAFLALALSLLNHTVVFSTIYCAARAFTDKLTFADIFTAFTIIQTIAALPISVSGIGVREKLSEKLLHSFFQVSGNIAVLISITSFLMMVVWCLIGGVIYLLYRSPGGGHARLREMQSEVNTLEEKIEHPQ
jgi:glycosyltransferase 2 family protein